MAVEAVTKNLRRVLRKSAKKLKHASRSPSRGSIANSTEYEIEVIKAGDSRLSEVDGK
jgi:hypothetical protein